MRELFNKIPSPWNYVAIISSIVAVMLIGLILTKINKRAFVRIQKNRNSIHLNFLRRVNSAVIVIACIVLAVSSVTSVDSLWRTVLGGTAIVSAVLAFAAQDVIKDILAGLMISVHRPFTIGDRVELENGTGGIVEDITMRHIVLRSIDTMRIVIPNSKINAMQITNMSVGEFDRSIHFRFSVGYDSDIALVKRVIFETVKDSQYSIPVSRRDGETPSYAPVYFIKFADSALIMAVTVYYEKSFSYETVANDINTSVREALIANGIEIPYNYVNVVNRTPSAEAFEDKDEC